MAAPYIDLDDVNVPPLAAPKVENATRIGITIKPTFPRVASPNGCSGIHNVEFDFEGLSLTITVEPPNNGHIEGKIIALY